MDFGRSSGKSSIWVHAHAEHARARGVRPRTRQVGGHARVRRRGHARAGARAVGVEASEEAVERASANASDNARASNSRFFTTDLYGDAGKGHAIWSKLEATPKALILDPPRSGAGPNLDSWVQVGSLQRVVYVSCNPVTFAEDAKVLAASGYVLQQVGVYDMFPGTAHVETVGLFSR